jgi:hypothetical protein
MVIFSFVVMVSPFIESLSIILAVQQHLPELSRPHFASYDNPPRTTPLERITVAADGHPCRAGSFLPAPLAISHLNGGLKRTRPTLLRVSFYVC